MNKVIRKLFFLSVCFCAAGVHACIWDYDTMAMETREFPEALDLITGKFLRHSPVYYQWRLEDRQAQLIQNPKDLDLYDDLATAHDKLGRSDLAIEIMLKKEKIQAGLYETEANLGTFYIHNKQYQQGLAHIKRAIKIKPDAHFGREIYQQKLVEYVVEKSRGGDLSLPLDQEDAYRKVGFAKWVLEDAILESQGKQELANAEKGILGMMRFGHYDSPILLEALGDILITKGDARRLACRAYLKASYECADEAAKLAYREKATKALRSQTKNSKTTKGLTLAEVETSFAKELTVARKWYSVVEKDETDWAAKGLNLDDEFKAKYYK